MSDLLATLAQHRDLILLAEIGAALHDVGKLGPRFIAGVLDDRDRKKKFPSGLPPKLHKNDEDPDKIFEEDAAVVPLKVRQPLVQLLSDSSQTSVSNLLGRISLADFVTRHHEDVEQLPPLLKMVALADKRDSGEDQYTAYGTGARQRMDVYGATVFGCETNPIDISCLDGARREVWEALADALQGNGDWSGRRDEVSNE